jgi:thiol-disulfide isomerase/thioredoxin
MGTQFAVRLVRLAAVLALVSGLEGRAADAPPGRGDQAPVPLGFARNGELVELERAGRKVQVVTFWASWCGPCMRELPMLEGLQRAAKDRVRVVAINIEERQRFRLLADKLSSLSLTLAHDHNKLASASYGVNGIPHLVIIGKDGNIIAVHRGYSEDAIDGILGEINGALAKP